jgi:hypothetical protein
MKASWDCHRDAINAAFWVRRERGAAMAARITLCYRQLTAKAMNLLELLAQQAKMSPLAGRHGPDWSKDHK